MVPFQLRFVTTLFRASPMHSRTIASAARSPKDVFHSNCAQELGKLLVLLHRNTSAGSLAALMKQFDLNQNNKLDFAEFVLLMQSLPEADEALLESAVNSQSEVHNQAAPMQHIELHPALASIGTQAQLTCISIREGTVIAGAQTGQVFIWDLEASFSICKVKHMRMYHLMVTAVVVRRTVFPMSATLALSRRHTCPSSVACSLCPAHPMAPLPCGAWLPACGCHIARCPAPFRLCCRGEILFLSPAGLQKCS
jgi:hypothetical protein